MRPLLRWPAALAGALAPCLSTALAGGFALEQQNARALGAAFAGAQARRADPGFAVYNPAALSGISTADLSVNATGVWSITSYEDAQGTLLGAFPVSGAANGEDFDGDAIIPNLSFATPLGDGLFVGLVLHSPFGLKTTFEPDSVLRYQAQESEALTIAVSPMLAVQLTDNLSIGASLRIQYIDVSVTAMIDAAGIAAASLIPGFVPGTSDLPASFDGDDLEVGFSAGFQAALSERLRVGASYASKMAHEIEGDAVFDLSVSAAGATLNTLTGLFAPSGLAADFETPAIAGLGAEFDAAARARLLASVTWTDWSAFERVAFVFDNPAQPPEILDQGWRDGWAFSVGGEYEAADRTLLRAGFMYDRTPANDAFASPRIPDADRYWATAGISQDFSERFSGDLGLAVAFFESRPINLSGTAPEAFFRGALSADIDTTAFAASARLRYQF